MLQWICSAEEWQFQVASLARAVVKTVRANFI
jgi:hypothetical protein